jgi:hypothetical protein
MSSPLREKLAEIQWTAPTRFTLDGIDFALEDVGLSDESDAFKVMKPAPMLAAYGEVLADAPARNILELGIRLGGSTVLLSSLFQPEKLVSIDISKPARDLERFQREHPDASRVAPYFRTSQADEAALDQIIAREFKGPLDLVIDDASHDYELTKASFDILFPRLRPGGYYVIEDWQWAHTRGFWEWVDKPALSNLVFQLMMVCAGRPELVAKVHVVPGQAFVRKGEAAPARERLDLDSLCWMQNRSFRLL